MRKELGPRKLAPRTAALLVVAAAAFLGVYSSGLLPASATSPHGNISIDVSGCTETADTASLPFPPSVADFCTSDNTSSSVGPIGTTNNLPPGHDVCNDGNPGFPAPAGYWVELVIGKPDGSGGIPAGQGLDIAGWSARITFDPQVLNFVTFQVADGASFYLDKASTNLANHLQVSNVNPGDVTIGSSVLRTPPGATGVGLLARIKFDCVGSGGTCINIEDVGIFQAGDSFWTDISGNSHDYVSGKRASLGVEGGTALNVSTCAAASEAGDGGDGGSGAGDGGAGDGDSGAGDGAVGDGDGGGAGDGDGAAGDGSGGATEVEFLATLAPGLNIAVNDPTNVTDGSTAVLASFADEDGKPLANVDITCKIEEQPGTDANLEGKTEVTVTTDAEGLAKTTLNTGTETGSIVVACSAGDQTKRVTVNVVEAGPATGVGSLGVTGDDDGAGGGGWLIPIIVAASGVGGLALIAGAAAYWRRYRRRA